MTKPLRWLGTHLLVARLTPALFVPAGIMLGVQTVQVGAIAQTVPARLITTALLLFCVELAYMAYVDLNNVAIVSACLFPQATPNPPDRVVPDYSNYVVSDGVVPDRAVAAQTGVPTSKLSESQIKAFATEQDLNRFFWVVISTVVLEIVGFYTALFLPVWGALTVIVSQIWFNLLASVQLFPGRMPAVVPFGISQRLDVLAANSAAVLLLILWLVFEMKMLSAVGLLTLVGLFLMVKYAPSVYQRMRDR